MHPVLQGREAGHRAGPQRGSLCNLGYREVRKQWVIAERIWRLEEPRGSGDDKGWGSRVGRRGRGAFGPV